MPWTLLLLFVLISLASACGPVGERRIEPFQNADVILISIDSLRPDHLGCYGYSRPTSPTIDRLAAQGILFREAVSTTSWTLPSHAALFTGLYDSSHGLVFDGLSLAKEHLTLAEALRDAGYQTAGFFGGPYLHPTYGLDQGFESYQSCMTRLPDDLPEARVRAEARGGVDAAHADITGPRTVEQVERWLENVGEGPFFLFLHLWDVHYDYIPPARYVELFDPDYSGSLDATRYMRNAAIQSSMAARDREHLLALYDGEIRFTDDTLREIFARIEGRGRLENALLVLTADHGDEFFEHGGKGHRRTLFDEVIRVPLILRLPRGHAGGLVIDEQVRLIDLMPTILSLLGVPLAVPVQGRDLTPLLRGESPAAVEALSELRQRRRGVRSLRTKASKLIVDSGGRVAYYDLSADPEELRPLPQRSAGLADARARLRELRQNSLAFREKLGERTPQEIEPDSSLLQRLEALGYLEEDLDSAKGTADHSGETK